MTKAKPSARDTFLEVFKNKKIDPAVIKAISGVDRPEFFDALFADKVYEFQPLPIGSGQHSDEPLTLAKMLTLLEPQKEWRVLEVGTGSGYSTALLSQLVREVVTVEYHEPLALGAKKRCIQNGFTNVRFFAGDPGDLDDELGAFDGVIILAACAHSPYGILNLLREEGRAVFPMGPAHQQQIATYRHTPGEDGLQSSFVFRDFCAFDSIRGRYGWVDRYGDYIVEKLDDEELERRKEKG